MSFRVTFRLFLTVCVLACLVWLFDRKKPPVERGMFWDVRNREVTELVIERGDIRLECIKKGKSWFLERPIRVRADDSKVAQVLGVLEAMPRQELVTLAQREGRRLTLRDYGFTKPRARLLIGSSVEGVKRSDEILVGCDAPLGDSLYVKYAAADEIVATKRGIMEVLPDKVEVLRDRVVFHGEASRASRIEIKRANEGFVQLVRNPDGWCIQQPTVARADGVKVRQMLEALYALRVRDFVWDASAETGTVRVAEAGNVSATKVETYKLTADEAVARITLWANGEDIGRELFLGKVADDKGDAVYARSKDSDSIFTVPGSIMGVIGAGINNLRDKDLFPVSRDDVNYVFVQGDDRKLVFCRSTNEGWTITEPVQWKADDHVVNELIDNVTLLRAESFATGTNQVDFGLTSPAFAVQVLTTAPNLYAGAGTNKAGEVDVRVGDAAKLADVTRGKLLIGALRPGQAKAFAQFENEPFVFEISTNSLAFLTKEQADPLVYRDRTMLAVDPDTVRRISVLKQGGEKVIERNEDGGWVVTGAVTNQVDAKAVDDVLFSAANMRAIRIECRNPVNLTQYGLDHPVVVLTLGLSGGKGIQKSISTGFRAGTDGVYAIVQGLDVVFVISNPVMDVLSRDLVK